MASGLDLIALRQSLHQQAESAFNEEKTAALVQQRLLDLGMEVVADDVAGHGILARMGAGSKRLLLRTDMDALPVAESSGVEHAAATGCHHACGHDGHMTMLLGALEQLAKKPPCEIWALIQPAEETGEGMEKCLAHEAFPDRFDHCLAIHNVPGQPKGTVLLRQGVGAVASTGIRWAFQGATSHAAEPHNGRNPIPAVARLVPLIERAAEDGDDLAVSALVHLEGGGPRFGTSAGDAAVSATMRAGTDDSLASMIQPITDAAEGEAKEGDFTLNVERIEPFPATMNDADTVDVLRKAFEKADILHAETDPFPWSEDFGHATAKWPGALVGLGSGEEQPNLHSPEYDFPDDLIGEGVNVWVTMVDALA